MAKILRNKIFIGLFFILMINFTGYNVPINNTIIQNNIVNDIHSNVISDLCDHSPIYIKSDMDFSKFPGTGTYDDPYIIEGLNITTRELYAIYINNTSKYFVIRNCYIRSDGKGIYISNVKSGTGKILNNTCIYNSYGTYIVNSSSLVIENNTYINNIYSIFIDKSKFTTINNNTCINENLENLFLVDSQSSIITNNTLIGNGIYIDNLLEDYHTYTIKNNSINGKKLGYFVDHQDLFIDKPDYGQLIVINCTNAKISNQNISKITIGIYIQNSNNITLFNNTCTYNIDTGIKVINSNYSTIVNSMLSYNADTGLYLNRSNFATIANNTCSHSRYGIYVTRSKFVVIANNTCSYNIFDGMYLNEAKSAMIINNAYFYNSNIGIRLLASNNSKIVNNTFSYNNEAMEIWDSGNLIIVNNTCIHNILFSISLSDSENSTITNNIFAYDIFGVHLYNSRSLKIINNTFIDDGIYFYGSLEEYFTHVVENNTVNGKQLGYFVDLQDRIIGQPDYGQMIFINCTNIEIRNQVITNTSIGISIYFSNNITLFNNTVINNHLMGMYLSHFNYSTIVNNIFSYNGLHGMYLSNSYFTTIANNRYFNNKMDGMYLEVYNSQISNNTCKNNWNDGIELVFSINTTITFNTCSNNYHNGISHYVSNNTIFKNNILFNNSNYGILLYHSENCVLFHNIFIDNNRINKDLQAYDDSKNNLWCNLTLKEGNFWSGWNKNIPHMIDGTDTMDQYPVYDIDHDSLNETIEILVHHTNPFSNDTDNDGMPDDWEVQYELNPVNSLDANQDKDKDGLTNLQEYQHGTNPISGDTDEDGLSDYDEVYTYNTDPIKDDTDGDGFLDGWEISNGLDPLNPYDGIRGILIQYGLLIFAILVSISVVVLIQIILKRHEKTFNSQIAAS